MEDDLRMISESVGRSLFGGLTITDPDKGLRTERLLDARDFSQYRIIACRFSEKRNLRTPFTAALCGTAAIRRGSRAPGKRAER